mmetsp:Transcript_19699/g.45317  ORF Transcript_19699/g.45317 Transcript_19699/m.45317 type:complete len:224 (+) Transcript_19699:496-1167(+)
MRQQASSVQRAHIARPCQAERTITSRTTSRAPCGVGILPRHHAVRKPHAAKWRGANSLIKMPTLVPSAAPKGTHERINGLPLRRVKADVHAADARRDRTHCPLGEQAELAALNVHVEEVDAMRQRILREKLVERERGHRHIGPRRLPDAGVSARVALRILLLRSAQVARVGHRARVEVDRAAARIVGGCQARNDWLKGVEHIHKHHLVLRPWRLLPQRCQGRK